VRHNQNQKRRVTTRPTKAAAIPPISVPPE
jgi:hypothetical protein